MPATQINREISVKSALADDVLLFKHMHCSERLGRLSEFRIEMSSPKLDIKIADVLGKDMTVTLDHAGGGKRFYNGIVTRFAYTGWRDGVASYQATVHPALWLLTRSSNCRIFQEMTAVEIVKQVCGDVAYGGLINLDVSQVSGSPAVRTYCVQYRESDFNFVCRLLEEEGIYFYFKHADGRHEVVLADSYGAHVSVDGFETMRFLDDEVQPDMVRVESVTMWCPSGEIQAGEYAMNDYDFEKSKACLSGGLQVKANIAAAFTNELYKQYDYPGLFRDAGAGSAFARARLETIHGQCEQIKGECSARGLTCGALFALTEHPRQDQNRDFLVTSAETNIFGVDYASGGKHGNALRFECSFTAVGKEHSYRAPAQMRKPFVQGPQTAIVVGKAGEEIWTDQYGRIKVQFHWDRLGQEDEKSSCWLRVAQSSAGQGWGAMFIPRIGMEVVVDFLEGDPDQPLVTGCVYNSGSMPPYALPGEQSKSAIRSNSTKGGGGYNEIRFEDKKGSEEVYVQAEKDYNRVVKNNDTLKVGFEKADKGDQTIGIKNDQSLEVGNNQTEKITNDQLLEVGNNQTVKITSDQKVNAGKTIVIEAGTSIELKVGASSIKIDAKQITVKSPMVTIGSDTQTEVKSSGPVVIGGAVVTIN